jgi:hypothetical protein
MVATSGPMGALIDGCSLWSTPASPEMVLGVDREAFVFVPPVAFPVLLEDVAQVPSAQVELKLELSRKLGLGGRDDLQAIGLALA